MGACFRSAAVYDAVPTQQSINKQQTQCNHTADNSISHAVTNVAVAHHSSGASKDAEEADHVEMTIVDDLQDDEKYQLTSGYDDNHSLSGDDFDDEKKVVDTVTTGSHTILLSHDQSAQLECSGFCELTNEEPTVSLLHLITVWIGLNYDGEAIISQDIHQIIYIFIGSVGYNLKEYVRIKSGGVDPKYFFTARINIKLSKLLNTMSDSQVMEVDKVRPDILAHALRYLAHHRGVKPEEIAKPIRSVKMSRICADQWDADFMNSLSKKTIFQLLLAAHVDCLDIECLVHLGSAKIATLIKGKSPEEIKDILADDGTDKE